ncbi:MAG TPA: carotenoid 1,2-hydratase [Syntrophaceae bacterium]|jgi:predicted secreted hydrolase|nr:carotenoid 1,2-hydratase [Syntrophaceae bacterium]
MKRLILRITMVLIAVLGVILMLPVPVPADGWKQAITQRSWHFPKDHGAHPDYRTEWWYFTGNLVGEKSNRYGYQLTFFRQGIQTERKNRRNAWSIHDVYLAHFAISDVGNGSFWFSEQVSRPGPGLAGASTHGMDVWCLNWRARMKNGRVLLDAKHGGTYLRLELIPRKPVVLHGENGLSRKGPLGGQATYYYSFTDLETKGILKTEKMSDPVNVTGKSWFDQEFGSHQLSAEQVGWDWFSLHLSDGRDLMIYMLRRKDGTVEPSSSGTLVEKNGRARHLKLQDIDIKPLAHWKSPASGGLYPSRWQIRIPPADISLVFSTTITNQELDTAGSTGVIYYEGTVSGKGTSSHKPLTSEGYVEMTGYAGSIGGVI